MDFERGPLYELAVSQIFGNQYLPTRSGSCCDYHGVPERQTMSFADLTGLQNRRQIIRLQLPLCVSVDDFASAIRRNGLGNIPGFGLLELR